MEREKLEKAVLQCIADGASIEAAAKEFKVSVRIFSMRKQRAEG